MAKSSKVRMNETVQPPGGWVLGIHAQVPLQRLAWAVGQIQGLQMSLYTGHHSSYDITDQFVRIENDDLLLLLVDSEWLQRRVKSKRNRPSPYNAFLMCPDDSILPCSREDIQKHLQGLSGITLVVPCEPSFDFLQLLSA